MVQKNLNNVGGIQGVTPVTYGDVVSPALFSVPSWYLYGTGTGSRTLDFHATTLTGNLNLHTDISIIGDLRVTGNIEFNNANRTITLEDGHGITSKIGFISGQATILGTNTFLQTSGYINTMTITGSLDRFIFDSKNGTQADSEKYICQSTITARDITLTANSRQYLHSGCGNTVFNTNIFHTFPSSSLDLFGGKSLTIS